MRQDKRTGEYLAFTPTTYDQGRGRYYMAYTVTDGWVEIDPEYATKCTKNVTTYPDRLYDGICRETGYLLNVAPRLYG